MRRGGICSAARHYETAPPCAGVFHGVDISDHRGGAWLGSRWNDVDVLRGNCSGAIDVATAADLESDAPVDAVSPGGVYRAVWGCVGGDYVRLVCSTTQNT